MATRVGLANRPIWGAYAKRHLGAYYLLDTLNQYGLTFPLSIKIDATRQDGEYDFTTQDQYYYCDRYCPTGNYWRMNYPWQKIIGVNGNILAEFFLYNTNSLGLKVTINNNDSASHTVELSLYGSAHAAMVSYNGSSLVQNYIYNSGSNYVAMSWSTQSTNVAVIGCSDTITPQDVKDSNYINSLEDTSNPYVGNLTGRSIRAKISFTIGANSSLTKVFAVGVDTNEANAAADVATVLSGYSTVLATRQATYTVSKSPYCTASSAYGALVETVLASVMHCCTYTQDNDNNWKMMFTPGRYYQAWWFWDTAFIALAFTECGYLALARDMLNFAFDTSGNYVAGWPAAWTYTVWRMYQVSNDKSILTNYYTSLKNYYNNAKATRSVSSGTYYKNLSGDDSGMDNLPIWTDYVVHSNTNNNPSPDVPAWLLNNAYYLNQMSIILNNGDTSTWQTEMSTLQTVLAAYWDSTNQSYYPLQSPGYGLMSNQTVANLLPVIYPGLNSMDATKVARIKTLIDTYYSASGEIETVAGGQPSSGGADIVLSPAWQGPSWMATNWLVTNGFRQNGATGNAGTYERQILNNWNLPYAMSLREMHYNDQTPGGARQFVSFTALLVCMAKTSGVRRQAL